jgi:hypothetical protein
MNNKQELPQYKCHKQVGALRIANIQVNPDGSALLSPEETGHHAFRVSAEYVNKHSPIVGGYYVRYDGGYESFSPETAFEAGYSPL